MQISILGNGREVGRSAFLVSDGKTKVMLDYGVKIQPEPPQYPIKAKADAVILSHAHLDHCLHPATYIQLADGTIDTIRNIYSSEATNKVISVDLDNSLDLDDMNFRKGITKSPAILYKIKTKSKTIKTTSEHRFFVLSGLDIVPKRAYELKKNDFIASLKKINFKGEVQDLPPVNLRGTYKIKLPTKTTNKLCQLLGYLLGDGDAYKGKRPHRKNGVVKRIGATDIDISLLKLYKNLIKEQFNLTANLKKRNDARGYRLRINSPILYDFIFEISNKILTKSRRREIPKIIHKATSGQVSGFLRGLFDAEGSVTGHKIALTTKSYNIAIVTQMLLLRFGIISHIYEQHIGFNERDSTYQLTIYNPESINKFLKSINFSSKIKKRKLLKLIRRIGGGIERIDIIPVSTELILENTKLRKIDLRKIGFSYYHYLNKKHYPSRNKLLELVKKIPKSKEIKKLKKLLNSEILWDRVVDIQEVNSDCDNVYDLEVPGHHNFIANGLVVHNSGGLPILYEKSKPNAFMTDITLDLSKMLLLDSIKVGKKNGYNVPFMKSDIKKMIKNTKLVKYKEKFRAGSFAATLYDAGHIPGSAGTLLKNKKTLFYTADIQTTDSNLLHGCKLPEKCDVLIIESTYSYKDHPSRKQEEERLIEHVEEALARDEKVLLPVFAAGRSQEVLLILEKYANKIALDGMAKKASDIVSGYPSYLKDKKRLKNILRKVHWVHGHESRIKAAQHFPIVIATAGMLGGGPAIHYLREMKHRVQSKVLFTGFLVEESPGRNLLETKIFQTAEEKFHVHCHLDQFQLSAHAGRSGLMHIIKKLNPETVVCIHGEKTKEFAHDIEKEFPSIQAIAPKNGDEIRV